MLLSMAMKVTGHSHCRLYPPRFVRTRMRVQASESSGSIAARTTYGKRTRAGEIYCTTFHPIDDLIREGSGGHGSEFYW